VTLFTAGRASARSCADIDFKPAARFVGTSDLSRSTGELWGIAWNRDADSLMSTPRAAPRSAQHPPFEAYQPGQLRRWLWAFEQSYNMSNMHVAVDDYTRDIDLPEHLELLPTLSTAARGDDAANGVAW
jgi:hypothetical protein